jgi:hypothetical protein
MQGVGEKWIFSSSSCSFDYGFEAVRIRVKETWRSVYINIYVVISKFHCILKYFCTVLDTDKVAFKVLMLTLIYVSNLKLSSFDSKND